MKTMNPEMMSESGGKKPATPKDWVKRSAIALCWYILVFGIFTLIVDTENPSDTSVYILMCLSAPALLVMMFHLASVTWGVLIGKYGDHRTLKIFGILILGPIATVYLAWNFKKYEKGI